MEWRKLVYPGVDEEHNRFLISDCGQLKNVNTGRIYKPELLSSGYLSVRASLGSRDRRRHIIIHKAVAYTFLPNPNNLPVINHIDGDPTNNCVNNLEWCTYGHNLQHAYDTGLFDKALISGERNHCAKLTDDDVKYIRDNYIPLSRTFGCGALSRKFGVSKTVILGIIHRTRWTSI